MILSRLASWLILVTAALAPWLAGARSYLPGVLWWLGGLLVSAFLLVAIERSQEKRWPRVSRLAVWPVLFLLGCTGWWATQQEPAFATIFAAEHWTFIENWNPAGQLQFPRGERLFFITSVLLGFWAAVDLGRKASFRRALGWTVGVCGLVVSAYSVGQRWLGWPAPDWLFASNGLDRFSSVFFNYSASAACLNMSWVWLVFGNCSRWKKGRWIASPAILLLVVAALAAWPATSGWGVAGILMVVGTAASFLFWKNSTVAPHLMLAAIAGLFLAAFFWQISWVHTMRATHSDHWLSAENSLMQAPARDAQLRALVALRSDHLVTSAAPALPAVWLTGARMAGDHLLLGVGPGSWVRESSLYSNDALVNTFFHMRQFAHHDLLQTAAEWGGLATVAWLVLWIGGIYRSARRCLTEGPEDIGLILALVSIALHSLVHFPLQVPALQIWTALALGLAWSQRSRPQVSRLPISG